MGQPNVLRREASAQSKNKKLPECSDWESLLLILHQHFFQGNNLFGVSPAPGLEDLTKGTLSNFCNLLILVRLFLAIWEVEFLQVAISVLSELKRLCMVTLKVSP